MRRYLILAIVAILAGCGTARTLVLEPTRVVDRFARVELVADNPTVAVPADVTQKIESVINKGLYESGAFSRGQDLKILYTFVSHNPGDRFSRWFWGGIGNAGEGSVVVLVRYIDLSGRELAKTQVEGRIGSGFFGGSLDDAITKAGEDIVKFTVTTFAVK
jgi:hypothetical protein